MTFADFLIIFYNFTDFNSREICAFLFVNNFNISYLASKPTYLTSIILLYPGNSIKPVY